ncbi:hypothetical protein GLU60_03625 [Nanohaloarchaea archaeon H01]|nr:hypothetical protein [Nanohaloarchaea archaeon H01]
MKKTLLCLTLICLTGLTAGVNFTAQVWDAEENVQNADITLEQQDSLIAEGSTIDQEINAGENYNLTQEVSGLEIKIKNFSIQEDFDFRPRILDIQTPEADDFLTDLDQFYFVNQSLNFNSASINTGKTNEPDRIAKCTSFQNLECQNWEINSTSDYNDNSGSLGTETYTYTVNDFSAYSSGNNASLPEIQNIEVFNATSQTDQRNDGKLIDEGLNKTFQIGQKNSGIYRFEFNISNSGSESWELTADDALQHSGLNQSWTVSDIYYRLNGVKENNDPSNDGSINWDTGNGGTVNPGESLSAEYIVNITQDSTNEFAQTFEANSTDGTSDRDKHVLKTLIYGNLEASIDRPENNSVLQNNREFKLNGTISCVDGDCGDIGSEPRRNTSTGQQAFDNQYFEVLNSNSTCSLLEDEQCTVEWDVNATGEKNTVHELDFEASSGYTKVDSTSTEENLVEIRDIIMMDLDWDVVDFGVLDPGEKENPAENNSDGYNLTIEEDSNTVDNLWVKASNLTSEQDSSYQIPYFNMSYDEQNQYPGTAFTQNYSLVDSDLAPGTVKTFYYWLDVPYGIIRGGYSGTITFKSNQTS